MKRCFIFAAGTFFGLRERPVPGDFIIAADAGFAERGAQVRVMNDWQVVGVARVFELMRIVRQRRCLKWRRAEDLEPAAAAIRAAHFAPSVRIFRRPDGRPPRPPALRRRSRSGSG